LSHEYGWTLEYIHDRLFFAQALALYSAISTRYDCKPLGPTYEDQDLHAALAALKLRS